MDVKDGPQIDFMGSSILKIALPNERLEKVGFYFFCSYYRKPVVIQTEEGYAWYSR